MPYRFLIRLAGPHAWTVPLLIIMALVATAAEGIGLGLMVFLLQLMLGKPGEAVGGAGLLNQIYQVAFSLVGTDVMVVAVTTVGLIIAKSLLIAGYNCVSSHLNATLNDRLRRLAFAQIMQADYARISGRDHGYFENIITSESLRTTDALWVVFQILVNICAIVVFGTMLLLISWQLVLVTALGTVTASLITMLMARRAKRLGDMFTNMSSRMASRAASVIGGVRMVRVFGRERDEMARFDRVSADVRRSFERVQYLKAATGPVSEGLYLLVFVGLVAVSTGIEMPLASVITFVVILGRLQPKVRDLDWARIHLSGLQASVQSIVAFLEQPPTHTKTQGTIHFDRLKQRIAFNNVSFAYPGDRDPTLRGISFDIPRGCITAIVGASGAGKSTITNLLLRLHEPTSGDISADGISISDYDVTSWRTRLAVAGQDAELIAGTILENITYGAPSASRAEVEQAAAKAGILQFVHELPSGWNTSVGERGLRLSGGQRQRISLARALLRRADLLILDEATNSLDSLIEAEIQAAVDAMAGSTTIVIIAHRLNTVMAADNVVVLRDGRIEEQGAPEELLARAGHFNELYGAQGAPRELLVGRA